MRIAGRGYFEGCISEWTSLAGLVTYAAYKGGSQAGAKINPSSIVLFAVITSISIQAFRFYTLDYYTNPLNSASIQLYPLAGVIGFWSDLFDVSAIFFNYSRFCCCNHCNLCLK
jgi:hypothetical protein